MTKRSPIRTGQAHPRAGRLLLVPTAVMFASSMVLAQAILTVDPLGGGNYTDLQAAVAASTPHSIILVNGGTYTPITVHHSLSILGLLPFRIAQPVNVSVQPPAILLQGTGTDTFVLSGAQVTSSVSSYYAHLGGEAIRATGFGSLWILDSVLRGSDWLGLGGDAHGLRAIQSDASSILVVRSSVAASMALRASVTWSYSGVPGIEAPSATVAILDSDVTGGSADRSISFGGPPQSMPCPCPGRAGYGGPAVVASTLLAVGSQLRGGTGSQVTVTGDPNVPGNQPWGQQPDGPEYTANSATVMPSELAIWNRMRLGALHGLTFPATKTVCLMAVGIPVVPPINVNGVGLVWVDPSAILATALLLRDEVKFDLPIPNNSALIGLPVAEQRFDLVSGGVTATNAIFDHIRP